MPELDPAFWPVMNLAELQGSKTRRAGIPLNANPHKGVTASFWKRGWTDEDFILRTGGVEDDE